MANLIPLHIDQLGGSSAYSGMLVLVFSIAAIVGRIAAGQLTDRRGRRRTLLLGCAAFLIGVAGPVLVSSVELLAIWRAWQGLGFAAITTATATLVADVLPKPRIAEGISYFGLGQSLSSAVGPSIGILLLGLGSISQAFMILVVAVCAVGAVALAAKSPWDAALRQRRLEPARKTGSLLGRLLERRAVPVFLIQFVASLAFSQYLSFLTLFGTRSGFEHPGLFFTLAAVAMILSRLFAAKHLHRFTTLLLFPLIFGIGATSFIIVATAPNELVFISAGLLFGLSFGLFMPLMGVISISLVPQSRWGAANAMNYLGADTGIGIGGVLAGVMIALVPFATVFWVGAGLMICACVLALCVVPSRILLQNGSKSND